LGKVYIITKVKRGPLNFKNKNIIVEKFEEFAPIFGIYTGLKYTKTKFNIFIPVDMPLISLRLIANLLRLRSNACYEINGKLNIFPLLLKKETFLYFENCIKTRNFKLRDILKALKVKVKKEKNIYNLTSFRNFNYKKDILKLY